MIPKNSFAVSLEWTRSDRLNVARQPIHFFWPPPFSPRQSRPLYTRILKHIHLRRQYLNITIEVQELLDEQGEFARELDAVLATRFG